MAADAAALLVPWQIVAVDRAFDRLGGGNELGRHLRCEKLRQVEERALADKLATQLVRIEFRL